MDLYSTIDGQQNHKHQTIMSGGGTISFSNQAKVENHRSKHADPAG